MVNLKLEDKVDLIFNSFNNEIKTLIIGFLIDESYQTLNQLLNKAKTLTYDDVTFKKKSVIGNYLDPERQGSLHLFVEEKEIKEGREKIKSLYTLSDFGREYGKPLARFLMYSTIKFDLPLTSWLGVSQQNGPASMVDLLTYLNNNSSCMVSDVINDLNPTRRALVLKLEKLKKRKIITYESFAKGSGIKYIKNPDKKYQGNTHFKNPKITNFILDYIKKNEEPFSYEDIIKSSNFVNRPAIQSSLRMLERRGYVLAITKWHGKERLSDINMTGRGKKIITDIINPIIGFIDNDKESIKKVLRKEIYIENIPLTMSIYRRGLEKG